MSGKELWEAIAIEALYQETKLKFSTLEQIGPPTKTNEVHTWTLKLVPPDRFTWALRAVDSKRRLAVTQWQLA